MYSICSMGMRVYCNTHLVLNAFKQILFKSKISNQKFKRGACRGIATWVEKNQGSSDGWYFILPNCFIDGKQGLAIKLHHGVSICWNGRLLHHCSTFNNLGKEMNNAVYGFYFGASNK